MDKYKLACQVAKDTKKPLREVIPIVDSLFRNMAETILTGERISITELGSFFLKVRNQRRGHDPHHNVPILIPESMVLKFRISPSLMNRIKMKYSHKTINDEMIAINEP